MSKEDFEKLMDLRNMLQTCVQNKTELEIEKAKSYRQGYFDALEDLFRMQKGISPQELAELAQKLEEN